MVKVTITVEKEGNICEINVPIKVIRSWYDFQYMVDKGLWENLELNKMDKDITKLFDISSVLIDCLDDGRTSAMLKNGEMVLTNQIYYHSGRKPDWRKKSETRKSSKSN